MNKKAGKYMIYVSIIIFIAGTILVFMNFGNFMTLIQPFTRKTPCEFAVLASHISTNIPLTSLNEILKDACPPEKIVFKKESAEDMNLRIAKSLYDCITMMGEGKTHVAKGKLFVGKTVCFKCSDFSFLENSKEVYEKANNDGMYFVKWLEKNDMPNKKKTFEQYFNEFIEKNIEGTNKLGLTYPNVLNPEQGYTIYMVKQEEAGTWWLDKIDLLGVREAYQKYSPNAIVANKILERFGYYSKGSVTQEKLDDLLRTRVTIVQSRDALNECEVVLNE